MLQFAAQGSPLAQAMIEAWHEAEFGAAYEGQVNQIGCRSRRNREALGVLAIGWDCPFNKTKNCTRTKAGVVWDGVSSAQRRCERAVTRSTADDRAAR